MRSRVALIIAVFAFLLGGLLATTQALAAPGQYLVFAVDPQDRISLLYYAEVDLALDAAAQKIHTTQPGHRLADGGLRLHASAYQQHRLTQAWNIDVPAAVRQEWLDADSRFQSLLVQDQQRAFVVRVAAAIDSLHFDLAGQAQTFDLQQARRDADQLPLASIPRGSPATMKGNGGSPANRVDLLIMGDGFSAADSAAFEAQADAAVADFVSVTPYLEYGALLNFTRLFTASAQSGADHPAFQAGCTSSSCCSDTEAQGDPRAGQFRNTAFDASFCSFQIQRLLTINTAKAFAAAAATPNWDTILMLVNDPEYGGSGGPIPVTSADDFAVAILIHEFGHSFTGLADEYSFANPGFPACSDLSGGAPCEPNVTNQTNPTSVKWKHWFTPGNPIPTPEGTDGVGLFQGARFLTSGMFRPVDFICLMNTLGVSTFCPVCSEAYVLKLYGGGFGVPAAGIDLIEPGSESPSTQTPVDYPTGTTQRFSVDVVLPQIDGIEQQWFLDGTPIGGANSNILDFISFSLTPAQRSLEFRVSDRSALLNASIAGARAVHSRTWTLAVRFGVDPNRVFRDGFEPTLPAASHR